MTKHRPVEVKAFVALFLIAALLAFGDGLMHIERHTSYLAALVPELSWSRDAVTVLLSARLSIALIPTALVWFARSNFARWMVTVLALCKLLNVPQAVRLADSFESISPYWAGSLAVALIAVALLFTPRSATYFSRRREVDSAVFD